MLKVAMSLSCVLLMVATAIVPSRAQDAEFWIRSFIPDKHDSNAGYVVPVPKQPDRTMVRGPIGGISDCFLTDQRMFDSAPDASSRIASHFVISLSKQKIRASDHPATFSTEVDCEDGGEECHKQVDSSRSRIGPARKEGNIIIVSIHGEANNACSTNSPDIHYDGVFRIDLAAKTISFKGTLGEFPAFEAYASINGEALTIFTMEPAFGSSALDVPFGRDIASTPVNY